jgi:hypothetical protein
LGTTGVLIASGLLLLVVVSTLVAFRGWPGDGLLDEIGSLAVEEEKPTLALSGPEQIAADAVPAAAAVAAAAAPGTAAAAPGTGGTAGTAAAAPGLTPGSGGGGPETGVPGGIVQPDPPLPPTDIPGQAPGGPTPPGLPGSVQDVTEDLGSGTRGLTGALGDSVGQVSPDLGRTVTETGAALSDIIEGLGLNPNSGPPQPPSR